LECLEKSRLSCHDPKTLKLLSLSILKLLKKAYVNWNMLQEMSEYGMCIKSHGDSHLNMTEISSDKAKQEFINSKKISPVNSIKM
jgi:hypothetical protein